MTTIPIGTGATITGHHRWEGEVVRITLHIGADHYNAELLSGRRRGHTTLVTRGDLTLIEEKTNDADNTPRQFDNEDHGKLTVDGSITVGWSIRKPTRIEYQPKRDITAHEVARLLPVLITTMSGQFSYPEDFIPDDLKRHFIIEAS